MRDAIKPRLLFSMAAILLSLQIAHPEAATFTSPKRIAGTTGADSEPPQLAVSGTNAYIVWHEFASTQSQIPEVYFSRSTNNGGTFGARVNLSNSAGVASSEEQIFVQGSNVFVAWIEDDGLQRKVCFRRSTNNGASFAARKELSDLRVPSNPRVTASGANVLVAWQNQDGSGVPDIYMSQSKDTGATFGGGADITRNASNSEFYFQDGGSLRQIAISGTKIILTWRDDGTANAGFETYFMQGSL
jgi:hypothetical protein